MRHFSHKEILDALRLIKAVCDSHEDCHECPFVFDNENCTFADGSSPGWWNLNEEVPEWRAFKE